MFGTPCLIHSSTTCWNSTKFRNFRPRFAHSRVLTSFAGLCFWQTLNGSLPFAFTAVFRNFIRTTSLT